MKLIITHNIKRLKRRSGNSLSLFDSLLITQWELPYCANSLICLWSLLRLGLQLLLVIVALVGEVLILLLQICYSIFEVVNVLFVMKILKFDSFEGIVEHYGRLNQVFFDGMNLISISQVKTLGFLLATDNTLPIEVALTLGVMIAVRAVKTTAVRHEVASLLKAQIAFEFFHNWTLFLRRPSLLMSRLGSDVSLLCVTVQSLIVLLIVLLVVVGVGSGILQCLRGLSASGVA